MGVGNSMEFEDMVSPGPRKNAKVIGNEIAWRGDDIIVVLKELSAAQVAVLGLESVVFPAAESGPLVEAISDSSDQLSEWRKSESWERCCDHALRRSVADIERNIPDPYRDDVWYIITA
jgi:hypothetical protein